MVTVSRRFRIDPLRGFVSRARRPVWLQELLQRRRDVLPLYTPQRAGWLIAFRRTILFAVVMITAMFYGVASAILPPALLAMIGAPYALLGLFVIWALPGSRTPPFKVLLRLFLVYFAVQLLWPNYIALDVGGLPWIALRRLVGTITTVVFLMCLSMSRPFRADLGVALKESRPISTLFLIFFVSSTISAFTSVSPSEAISRWIGTTLVNTPMFFVTIWIFATGVRTFDWWINRFMIFVAILMVIGVLEYHEKHILWANSIPSFLHVDEQMLNMILTPNFRNGYRISTTFTGPLSWGELTALAIPFALHRLFNAKTNASQLLWAAYDLALVSSGYMSGARLAVVGAILAHTVYVFLWAVRRWRNHPGSLIGVSAMMMYPAFMVALLGAILFVPAVHNRVLGGGATQGSSQARQEQFRMTIPAVAKRPLFGYGPGAGAYAVGWRNGAGFLSIDSAFLSTAADEGLIGFGTYFGGVIALMIILSISGVLWKGNGMPFDFALVAVFATFLSTRSVLSQWDSDMLYWMLFGIGIAVVYRNRTGQLVHAGAEQYGSEDVRAPDPLGRPLVA